MTNASTFIAPELYELVAHLNRKKKNTDKAQFKNNHQQELIIDHYNYNDGLSLTIDQTDFAYAKVIHCLKMRCEVLKDTLGWAP